MTSMSSQRSDLFDPTPRSHMLELMSAERPGDLNRFLMEAYARPLAAYLSATSFRQLGPCDDLVAGFFASRLDRREWIEAWVQSGLRLRRWLVNGLLLYAKEELRRRGRDQVVEGDVEPLSPSVERLFDRTYAREVVRLACEQAAASCGADGLSLHWSLFLRHHADGRTYAALAAEEELSEGRVVGFIRTATGRFREAVARLLVRDGANREELDREIAALLEGLAEK
jgi:hypothetical protein